MRAEAREHVERAVGHKNRRYIWLFIAMLTLTVLVVALTPKQRVLPRDLIGVWTTTDPAYRDRFLAINWGSVSFGTGAGTVTTGFVKSVEEVHQGSVLVYSLTYTSDEGEQRLSFSFEPASGAVRLQNQPRIVWKRAGNL